MLSDNDARRQSLSLPLVVQDFFGSYRGPQVGKAGHPFLQNEC